MVFGSKDRKREKARAEKEKAKGKEKERKKKGKRKGKRNVSNDVPVGSCAHCVSVQGDSRCSSTVKGKVRRGDRGR